MFESLDDQMKLDENKVSTSKERALRWVLVVVVTAVLFGGLYWGVHMLEGS
jgi:hypothetical protein